MCNDELELSTPAYWFGIRSLLLFGVCSLTALRIVTTIEAFTFENQRRGGAFLFEELLEFV